MAVEYEWRTYIRVLILELCQEHGQEVFDGVVLAQERSQSHDDTSQVGFYLHVCLTDHGTDDR